MRYFGLLVGLIIGLSSCNFTKPAATNNPQSITFNNTEFAMDSVFFYFKQTPCYGTCPHQELIILKSGQALYHGYSNVENRGDFKRSLSPDEIAFFELLLINNNFYQLKDNYTAAVTDFPTYTLFGNFDSEKSVTAYYDIPKNLTHIIGELEQFCANTRWDKK